MTLLYGAAASSKGTIVRVVIGLIGAGNVGTLRTSKLAERFEMGRHRHKRLLYGPDVNEDFLRNQGAALLKAITGEDAISPEYKCSNATPAAKPITASVIVTANTRLRIGLQGDKEAWRRRLIVIRCDDEVPESERVTGFSQTLLDAEGPGILNWALEGARRVLADGGKILLNDRQKGVRDAILDESDSPIAFAREEVVKDPTGRLFASRALNAYVQFCFRRGWKPETEQQFYTEFKKAVMDFHGITQATDLPGEHGNVRGWRRLRLKQDLSGDEDEF
jgi:phage/plasmid-associated DNA primase